MDKRQPNHFTGCLLGGAVGDALGYPVEFDSYDEIQSKYGSVTGYITSGSGPALISDDTQMTLFTAEGMLRAFCRGKQRGVMPPFTQIVHRAYLRWLLTQESSDPPNPNSRRTDGRLITTRELYALRAPGNTCLSALRSGKMGAINEPINNSKGCGGIMRVAPVGLIMFPDQVFDTACEIASITHGHPSGYLAAGTFAEIISCIISGLPLAEAISAALDILKTWPGHQECLDAVTQALTLATTKSPNVRNIERLGGGWVAEEALAISLYCSLTAEDDFAAGVLLAVNHSGDSDSTGSITGNILGALLGRDAIPTPWLEQLELRHLIEETALDLLQQYEDTDEWFLKYPGD